MASILDAIRGSQQISQQSNLRNLMGIAAQEQQAQEQRQSLSTIQNPIFRDFIESGSVLPVGAVGSAAVQGGRAMLPLLGAAGAGIVTALQNRPEVAGGLGKLLIQSPEQFSQTLLNNPLGLLMNQSAKTQLEQDPSLKAVQFPGGGVLEGPTAGEIQDTGVIQEPRPIPRGDEGIIAEPLGDDIGPLELTGAPPTEMPTREEFPLDSVPAQLKNPVVRQEKIDNANAGVGETADLAVKGEDQPKKVMAWGADWLGVNVREGQVVQSPEGIRFGEREGKWAVRDGAARWIEKMKSQGVDHVVLVANVTPQGLKTNPLAMEAIQADLRSRHKNVDKLKATATKEVDKFLADKKEAGTLTNSDRETRDFRITAAIAKGVGENMTSLLTKISESEGQLFSGQVFASAKVDRLERDEEHPSYPIKVHFSDYKELGTKADFKEVAAQSGVDKSPFLRLRSNNVVLDTEMSSLLAESLKTGKPMSETFRTHQIGITPTTEKIPEIAKLVEGARKAKKQGDFALVEQLENQILDTGEKDLKNIFNDVEGVEISVKRTIGNYYEQEPTFWTTVTYPKTQEGVVARRLAELGEKWKQDTIHIGEVLTKPVENATLGKEFGDGYSFEPQFDLLLNRNISNEEYDKLNKILQQKGFAGSTLLPEGIGINIYNVSRGDFKMSPAQFRKAVKNVIEELHSQTIFLGSGEGQPGIRVEESIPGIRRLLIIGNPASGATRTYDQVRDFISPAEKLTPTQAKQIQHIKGTPIPKGKSVSTGQAQGEPKRGDK